MIEIGRNGRVGSFSKTGKLIENKYKYENPNKKNAAQKIINSKTLLVLNPSIANYNTIKDKLLILPIYPFGTKEGYKQIKGKFKKSKVELVIKNILKNKKYHYHNTHVINDERKKSLQIPEPKPGCYDPKYSLIKPRILTGPKWKILKGRKEIKNETEKKEYFEINNNKNNTKKDEKRMEFLNHKDKNEKARNSKDTKDLEKKFGKIINQEIKSSNKANKSKYIINSISRNKDKYIYKKKSAKQVCFNKYKKIFSHDDLISLSDNVAGNSKTISNFGFVRKKEKVIKMCKSEKIIKAPDFSKIVPRKEVCQINPFSYGILSPISPNYSFIKERTLSFTKYEQKSTTKKRKPKLFIGLDPNIFFDSDKIKDKFNNHIIPKVPNFNLMLSRNEGRNLSLPCFMQNIRDRGSLNNITEKSLEQNNYFNGIFKSASTSFFPKNTFNNIINLNILKSKNLKISKKDEDTKMKIKHLKNRLIFKHKGYVELIKEGALKKFDNITYKTNFSDSDEFKQLFFNFKK